ncbi:MAG: RsmG family class I SAM-dependent methyltransferase [Candidatus Zixiibacteriota bacterium]
MINKITPVEYSADVLLQKYIDRIALERYFQTLLAFNRKVNLVSRETSPADLTRLTVESLLPLNVIEKENPDFNISSYLDIGSGGGFPSIPIILSRNIETVRLLERTAKKALALEKIIEELQLKAEILPKNFEEVKFNRTFMLITLRYVKLTEPLLKRIFRLLDDGGCFVYYSATELELYKNSARLYAFEYSEPAVNKYLTIYRK